MFYCRVKFYCIYHGHRLKRPVIIITSFKFAFILCTYLAFIPTVVAIFSIVHGSIIGTKTLYVPICLLVEARAYWSQSNLFSLVFQSRRNFTSTTLISSQHNLNLSLQEPHLPPLYIRPSQFGSRIGLTAFPSVFGRPNIGLPNTVMKRREIGRGTSLCPGAQCVLETPRGPYYTRWT